MNKNRLSLRSWRYFWRARSEGFWVFGFFGGGTPAEPPRARGKAARNSGFAASSGPTAKTLFRVRLYNNASYAG